MRRTHFLSHIANLQPWREEKHARAKKRLGIGVMLSLLMAIGMYAYQGQSFTPQREQLAASVRILEQQLAQGKLKQRQLQQSRLDFSSLINAQRLYLGIHLLQRGLPKDVRILSIELHEALLFFGSTYRKDSLTALVAHLETQPLVREASLRQVSEQAGDWKFSLHLKLNHERMASLLDHDCVAPDCKV